MGPASVTASGLSSSAIEERSGVVGSEIKFCEVKNGSCFFCPVKNEFLLKQGNSLVTNASRTGGSQAVNLCSIPCRK